MQNSSSIISPVALGGKVQNLPAYFSLYSLTSATLISGAPLLKSSALVSCLCYKYLSHKQQRSVCFANHHFAKTRIHVQKNSLDFSKYNVRGIRPIPWRFRVSSFGKNSLIAHVITLRGPKSENLRAEQNVYWIYKTAEDPHFPLDRHRALRLRGFLWEASSGTLPKGFTIMFHVYIRFEKGIYIQRYWNM